jgi:hypothetical protein
MTVSKDDEREREIDGERCNFVDCDDIDHSYRPVLDSLSRIWTNHFCYQRLYKRRPTGECEEIHGKNTLL